MWEKCTLQQQSSYICPSPGGIHMQLSWKRMGYRYLHTELPASASFLIHTTDCITNGRQPCNISEVRVDQNKEVLFLGSTGASTHSSHHSFPLTRRFPPRPVHTFLHLPTPSRTFPHLSTPSLVGSPTAKGKKRHLSLPIQRQEATSGKKENPPFAIYSQSISR